MPQFHETMYGKKFFDGQLPMLIHALKSISGSLENISELLGEQVDEVKSEVDFDTNAANLIQEYRRKYPMLSEVPDEKVMIVITCLDLISDAYFRIATNPDKAYYDSMLLKCNEWMLRIHDIIYQPRD
ncbi:MAG: hypothetical protein ACOYEB_06865 [Enterococcus lemanii]|jgi:hypothetical protein